MESPKAPARVDRVATAGLSSRYDALAAALLRASEPNRRHLVIALTKAEDTISTIDGQTLSELARRSDAVLHVVEGDSLVGNTQCQLAVPGPAGFDGRSQPRVDPETSQPELPRITAGRARRPLWSCAHFQSDGSGDPFIERIRPRSRR